MRGETIGVATLLLAALAATGCTGIARISVASDGSQATGAAGPGQPLSHDPAVSNGGRFVAFVSGAANLVPGDTNGDDDVFVRDTVAGTTVRASVRTDGGQANGFSSGPDISADGRFVMFTSNATNLVTGDTNGTYDVFVRDLVAKTTRLVSRQTNGSPAANASRGWKISDDGRYVLFSSSPSVTPNALYRTDLTTGTVVKVADPPVCSFTDTRGTIGLADMSGSGDEAFAFVENCPGLVSGTQHLFEKPSLTDGPTEVYLTYEQGFGDSVEISSLDDEVGSQFGGLIWTVHYSGHGELAELHEWTQYSDDTIDDPETGLPIQSRDAAFCRGQGVVYTELPAIGQGPGDGRLRVLNLLNHTVKDISVSTTGAVRTGNLDPDCSPDGTTVGFTSFASDLVPKDTNGVADVFTRPLSTLAGAGAASATRVSG
jgi:hypothetical protein